MNYFNHQNVQLAYEAIYNQDLCESMEDLGLIGEYDYLDEAEGSYGQTPKALERAIELSKNRILVSQGDIFSKRNNKKINTRAKRIQDVRKHLDRMSLSHRTEQADLYDIILSHLLDEGYAETLGSAEIILENMSDEWIEDIMEAKWGKQPYPLAKVEKRGNTFEKRLGEMQRDFAAGGITPEGAKRALNTSVSLERLSRSYGAAIRNRPQPIPPGRKGSTFRRGR